MKKIISMGQAFLLALAFVACNNGETNTETASSEGGDIAPKEAAEIIKKDKVKVLDVRTPEEYQEGHLQDAILIDFYDPDFENEIDKLPRDITYVVYCHSGGRSAKAVDKMEEMGFENVYNVDGGMREWKKEGLEVKK